MALSNTKSLSPRRRQVQVAQMKSIKHRDPTRLQEWLVANDILPSELMRYMVGGEISRQWLTKLRWKTPKGEDTTLATMKKILRAARLALAAKTKGQQKQEGPSAIVQMADLFDLEPDTTPAADQS